MLAQCPKFEPGQSEWAELGADRHDALEAYFKGDDELLILLDEESQQGITWAAEYIRLHAPASDFPMHWETLITSDELDMKGTPDCVCGPELFDFKWRPRDYTAQMAAYAMMRFEHAPDLPRVTAHLLFGATRHAEKINFDRDSARAHVMAVVAKVEDPKAKPTPCDYCGWCADRVRCPALTGPAKVVAEGYGDGALGIANWHPSEMTNPEQIALALTIWRRVLKKWGESIEFHALEAATKQGLSLPGYDLKTRDGNRYVSDTLRAYELSGLDPATFLKTCSVRLNTSRTYPDQIGLDKVLQERDGITAAAARRKVDKHFAEVIARTKSVTYLRSKTDAVD